MVRSCRVQAGSGTAGGGSKTRVPPLQRASASREWHVEHRSTLPTHDELKVSSGKGETPGDWQFAYLVEVLERVSRSYLSKYRITFRLSSSE